MRSGVGFGLDIVFYVEYKGGWLHYTISESNGVSYDALSIANCIDSGLKLNWFNSTKAINHQLNNKVLFTIRINVDGYHKTIN